MLGIAIPLVFILAVMGIVLVVKGRRRGPHREVFVDVSGIVLAMDEYFEENLTGCDHCY